MYKLKGIKLRWATNNLSVVLLLLITLFVVFCSVSYNFYYTNLEEQLKNRAQVNARLFNTFINQTADDYYMGARRSIEAFSDKDKLELQFLDNRGRVIFSSSGISPGYQPGTADVERALSDATYGSFVGRDPLTEQRIMATSAKVSLQNGETVGAVRMVSALSGIDAKVRQSIYWCLVVMALVFFFVFYSNRFFIRSIVNPIKEINDIAKEIATGNYGVQIQKKFDDEIGELCDTINHMSTEIELAQRMKNEFISSVSHELRTPLTAITGWTETLLDGGISGSWQDKKGLLVIRNESERLRIMLEELLDFSKMQAGRLYIRLEKLDICAEVDDVVFAFTQRLRYEGLAITSDCPSDPIFVAGDRDRLKQVLINIIDNAAKHAHDGQKIEVSVHEENDFARISVRDYGQGIPQSDLPYVKEKFYKANSKSRGSGIGLAVSDEIISMHGGRLKIESVVGEGTIVSIYIPIEMSEDER